MEKALVTGPGKQKNKAGLVLVRKSGFTSNVKSLLDCSKRLFTLWAQLGSNQRPKDYESSTLTN